MNETHIDNEKIAKRIRELRKSNGLTQQAVNEILKQIYPVAQELCKLSKNRQK